MRALQAAVILMGVLILGATAAVIGIIVHRASAPRPPALAHAGPASPITLDEPAGTRIAAASTADDRLVLQLTGGGPDRVVVLDLRGGAVLARVGLAR
jgi:hypothetical protein